jgi:hypothetical protein
MALVLTALTVFGFEGFGELIELISGLNGLEGELIGEITSEMVRVVKDSVVFFCLVGGTMRQIRVTDNSNWFGVQDGEIVCLEEVDVCETDTYRIPEQNIVALDEAIIKLNKKAAKLGCPPVSVNTVKIEKKAIIEDEEVVGYEVYHHVEVQGESPKLPGWSFEGVVDLADEDIDGYILRRPAGATPLPVEFRYSLDTDPTRCDHCHTNRQRTQTFIVKNDEGNYLLVGRSCLKDFTGHNSPEGLASYFMWVKELGEQLEDEEFFGGSYNGPLVYDLERFLSMVSYAVRKGGFITRGEAESAYPPIASTSDTALYLLREKALYLIEQKDKETATQIIEYLPTIWEEKDNEYLSEYELNMKNAFSSGVVSHRTAGLIASAYISFSKNNNSILNNSEYQGQIKERLILDVTCYFTKAIESYYGVSILCKFHDDQGNIYTWFNSGCREVEVGHTYILRGTVKAHNEYNGKKETQLTRCYLAD